MTGAIAPADRTIREFIYSLIEGPNIETAVDVGCGRGFDLGQLATRLPGARELIGIDVIEESADKAADNLSHDQRIKIVSADIAQGIPLPDHCADLVYSNNVLECIVDKASLIREIHRVLRPDGQVICAHYDWDTIVVDGSDKALIRKIVHAFGDCKQNWMADCDSWMGRRLWRTFQQTRLFKGAIHAKTLAETDFAPGTYGYETVQSFELLVRRGLLSQQEFDEFISNIVHLQSEMVYIFSVTMYAYSGSPIGNRLPD